MRSTPRTGPLTLATLAVLCTAACRVEFDREQRIPCDATHPCAVGYECCAVDGMCTRPEACIGCGDGDCEPTKGEDCAVCSRDCGLCPGCGNGLCDGVEDCFSCALDCGLCAACGDFVCDTTTGEDCATCPTDCSVCVGCGDGFCDEMFGETCVNCFPDCNACVGCGDGTCEMMTEDCSSCPNDCGVCPIPICGDLMCDWPVGEDCNSCPTDCLTGPPSCVGLCGSFWGGDCMCHCDAICEAAGDCCNDYVTECVPN